MNNKAGGSWKGKSTCPKCGGVFDDYKAGSWDWKKHLCPECQAYEILLKLDEKKKERGR